MFLLPSDVLELVFTCMDLKSNFRARAVCREWREVGQRHDVVVSAAANTRALTRSQLTRMLGIRDVSMLPSRPFVTSRGRTCWWFGPEAVDKGLRLVLTSGRHANHPLQRKRKLGREREACKRNLTADWG